MDGPDAGDNVFDGPLTSEDIEKLKARRTHMNGICNRIGDRGTAQVDKEFWIQKIRMIC